MVHLGLVEVLGDVRHRRANQNGPMHPGGCRRRQLLGSLETDGAAAMQPGPVQEGPPTIAKPTAEKGLRQLGVCRQASELRPGREERPLPDKVLQVLVLPMSRVIWPDHRRDEPSITGRFIPPRLQPFLCVRSSS